MRKRIIGILTSVVLLFSLITIAGCGIKKADEKTPGEYDLKALTWADSNDDGVYTASKPDGNLKLVYNKGSNNWSNIAATFVNTTYDLNLYKSLNIKVLPNYTTTFSGKLLFKLEGTQAAELWVYASSYSNISAASDGSYTYSWDISNLKYDVDGTAKTLDLNKDVNLLRIFVEPEVFSVAGELLFSDISFSKSTAVTANKVVSGTNENKELVNSNIVKPTLTTLAYSVDDEVEIEVDGDERTVFPFNKNWGDISGMNTHSFAAPATDGSVAVTVKKVGMEWANGAMKISGVPAEYRYAIMVVKGSSAIHDKSVMFKASGANVEKSAKFVNGDLVTIQVRLAEKTADLTGFEVFAFNGDAGNYQNVSFTIVEAYLTKAKVLDEIIVPDNVYVSGDEFDVTNNWFDVSDHGNWLVAYADGETTLTLNRTLHAWDAARTNIKDLADGFTTLTIDITAPAKLSIISVLGLTWVEKEFTFKGTRETIIFDLTKNKDGAPISDVSSAITGINIFFDFSEDIASGTIIIHSAVFSKA